MFQQGQWTCPENPAGGEFNSQAHQRTAKTAAAVLSALAKIMLVMKTTRDNYYFRFFDLIHKTMFTVDPSGPATDELEP